MITIKLTILGIESNLAANVTALETKFQVLQESVEALQTSLDSVLGMMTTFQSTSGKLGKNYLQHFTNSVLSIVNDVGKQYSTVASPS